MSGVRVWTGFPLPWGPGEQLDEGALRELLGKCAAAGSHGL